MQTKKTKNIIAKSGILVSLFCVTSMVLIFAMPFLYREFFKRDSSGENYKKEVNSRLRPMKTTLNKLDQDYKFSAVTAKHYIESQKATSNKLLDVIVDSEPIKIKWIMNLMVNTVDKLGHITNDDEYKNEIIFLAFKETR